MAGQAKIPKNSKVVVQIVVGGMIGLGFTMDMVHELKRILIPTVILVCGLMILSRLIGLLIHKLTGMDLATSLFTNASTGLADIFIGDG